MWSLSKTIQPQDRLETPHVPTHGRKAIQLRCLWKRLHPRGSNGEACWHPQEESSSCWWGTDVTAGRPSCVLATWSPPSSLIVPYQQQYNNITRTHWISVKRAWWRNYFDIKLDTSHERKEVISLRCHMQSYQSNIKHTYNKVIMHYDVGASWENFINLEAYDREELYNAVSKLNIL